MSGTSIIRIPLISDQFQIVRISAASLEIYRIHIKFLLCNPFSLNLHNLFIFLIHHKDSFLLQNLPFLALFLYSITLAYLLCFFYNISLLLQVHLIKEGLPTDITLCYLLFFHLLLFSFFFLVYVVL